MIMTDPAQLEKELARHRAAPLGQVQERPNSDAVQWSRKSGKLSYDSAIQLLRSGQSITHQGRLIENIAQMPSRMAWADTEEDRKIAQELLDRDKYELQKRLDEANSISSQPMAPPPRDPAWTDAEYAAFCGGGPKPEASRETKKKG
jgi:hypothetical protein